MIYISSDTNVWIDFVTIEKLELPFKLPYTYIMSKEAIEDELLSPPGLGTKLASYGLIPVEITIEEFLLPDEFGKQYRKLSVYDRMALAIAKCRKITLLTGDAALRKTAKLESVELMGTLGLLDKLLEQNEITAREYKTCLKRLLLNNGKAIRLPDAAIRSRLRRFIDVEN